MVMTRKPRLTPLARRRTVADVMRREVVAVTPDTSFKEVARLLTQLRVSALPVTATDGHLLGVVSESDLLAKERRLERPLLGRVRRRWLEEHVRAEASMVRHLMSTPAITVDSAATLQEAARLMNRRGVHCLCVTDGRSPLVGIVTRGDLLRAFVRPDEAIEREIYDDLMGRVLWMDPREITVEVVDGLVRFQGEVEQRSRAESLVALAREVEGVVAVENRLTWRFDDRAIDRAIIPLF
jgi:CBS domain-containing protein